MKIMGNVLILDTTLYEGSAEVVELLYELQDAANNEAIRAFYEAKEKQENKPKSKPKHTKSV